MKSKIFFVTFFILLGQSTYCQNVNLDSHFEKQAFKHASVGLTIVDAISGDVVYDHNGDLGLIPASTLKTVTTFSALERFGTDYRYQTNFYLQGEKLDDGSFYGNIIVKGSGDPSLGSPIFEKAISVEEISDTVIKAIKLEGISCIEGSIIFDNSLFNDSPVNPSWQWNDLSNYYASGVWPFNVHENLFFIHFNRSTKEYAPTSISHIIPKVPNITIDSEVSTGSINSGDNAYVYSHPFSDKLKIEGTIPPGEGTFDIKAALPQPDKYFKKELIQALFIKGVSISNSQVDIHFDSKPKLISTISSPTLSDIVKEANLKSNNLYCEALLKLLGTAAQATGSTQAGIESVKEQMGLLGIEVESLTCKDGSGLSNRNRIPSSVLSSFLQKIYKRHNNGYLERHLSHAHPDGDITYFFRDSNGEYDIYLKSGSMSQVMAYCGLIKSQKRTYCFSFISNGHLQGNRSIRIAFEEIIKDFVLN